MKITPEWFEKKKQATAKLPHLEVSEEEFVHLFVENGGKLEKAKFHAKMSKELGSYIEIGQQMIKVCEK